MVEWFCIFVLMIRIERFKKEENPEFAEMAFSIRRHVFVYEHNVDPELEHDEYESSAWHYLLFKDEQPVATARWRETDNGIKLERFATLTEYRNRRLGAVILKRVMADVLLLSKPIYLHSQIKALSFYERFGFVKEGNIFIDADIRHYMMKYKG